MHHLKPVFLSSCDPWKPHRFQNICAYLTSRRSMSHSHSAACFHPVTRQWRQDSGYSTLKHVFLKYKSVWKDSEFQLSIFFSFQGHWTFFVPIIYLPNVSGKSHSRVITVSSITPIECGFRICERFGIGEKVRVPWEIPELMRLK